MGRSAPCSQRSNITSRSEFRKTSSLCQCTAKNSTKNVKIDYGFPVFSVTWEKIKYMVYASYILNAIVIIFSICLLYAAYRISVNISKFLNLITSHDGYFIPLCLFVVGFLCLLISSLLIYATIKSCHKSKNEYVNKIFFIFILICLVISFIVIALGIFTHNLKSTLDCRVHDGILEGMQNYKTDCDMKRKIDTLQLTFQCCGSNGFNDWFTIKWYDSPTGSGMENCNADDTPFSCCSMHSALPCIHHNILSVGTAYLYAPESNLSISEYGCMPVLTCYTKLLTWRIALSFFILGTLLLIITCLSRFLQSAHMELYRFNRNSYWHTCWLFGRYRGKKKKKSKTPPVPPPFPCELCS